LKIEKVRIRHVHGTMPVTGRFWENRLCRPVDVYEDHARDDRRHETGPMQVKDDALELDTYFLEILTDEGVTGCSGPFRAGCAHMVASTLRPILLGEDPLRTEYLWDVMHRLLVHGRQGEAMFAISVVDLALWDLKGKWLGQPVWRILGGSTRAEIPAYCSMLGYEVTDMGLVRERAQEFKEKGFKAQKWFFRHGPMASHAGLKANVAMVRTLRETLGDDYDIMLDCWQSFDYPYLLKLAEQIEPYRPYWIEEVAMPDRIATYRKNKEKIRYPLAGAEHDYTRWGMKRFLDADALDIYQPDPYWCGGLSETLKICALTTTHDLICIPHGHSTQANIQISALQSPIHTPYQEYLWKWNEVHQFFFQGPLKPEGGMLQLPQQPGICPDIDLAKIDREEDI